MTESNATVPRLDRARLNQGFNNALLRAAIQLSDGPVPLSQHPAVKPLLKADKNGQWTLKEQSMDASSVLQVIASCMGHQDCLPVFVQEFRPFLLDILTRFVRPSTVVYAIENGSTIIECNDSIQRSEVIAGALAELLSYVPKSGQSVIFHHFRDSQCFFELASIPSSPAKKNKQQLERRLASVLQTALKLLQFDPNTFITMWNWTPIFPLCFHNNNSVRWYAARCTIIVLQMNSTQRNAFLAQLGVDTTSGTASQNSGAQEIELAHHVQLAKQEDESIASVLHESRFEHVSDEQIQPISFHESLCNIFGVLLPSHTDSRLSDESEKPSQQPLVNTDGTKQNLRSLAIALGMSKPILVSGTSGGGKTASIRELARLAQNPELVELHLDDQIDSKTLLGTYVCTDVPGEFTWQPGALTTAVTEGRWVVIEDIDRAPFEVLAALMPLLETREMEMPGRGEKLVAHSNFQLFATTTTGRQLPRGFQSSIWTVINLQTLPLSEVLQVLQSKFRTIPSQWLGKIMQTYELVSGKADEKSFTNWKLWNETRRNYGREFGLRDLLKWCRRITTFCRVQNSSDTESERTYRTEEDRVQVLVEAFDVFCAGIREPNTRMQAAVAIARVWEIEETRIMNLLEQHKPHFSSSSKEVTVGRVHMVRMESANYYATDNASMVMTGDVLRLLEKMAAVVHTKEPALLVGETGCGKTTVIQHLAASIGQKLVVQNLNVQSDSADLVGGFKPVELHLLAKPLYLSFIDLFAATVSQTRNAEFLNLIRTAFEKKLWGKMVQGMRKAVGMANAKLRKGDAEKDAKKMALDGGSSSVLRSKWEDFEADLDRFERQKEQVESHFAFAFVEGVLVKALREGHWVLLDELNLASSDTLERISTLLEHDTSAFSLTERGDVEIIRPHPNFRLFGAMNPSTDVGKKDLPPALRNRFTEIYVDECVNKPDLQMIVERQFRELSAPPVTETVDFYLDARKQAEEKLSDGARHKPRYSLRTLSQALHITRILIQRGYGLQRALYEGFCSTFCAQLELESKHALERTVKNVFAKQMKAKELLRAPPRPGGKKTDDEFLLVSSYWLTKGENMEPVDEAEVDPTTNRRKFVLTKAVEENLRHLARAAVIGTYPVLLQGPTSAGKTSLVTYLAARLGQKCVRINNHEHTDIQEYLGSYVSDSNGRLTFQEGVLVEAVRHGWWIILDELNLAPSEVLEALNRLLDDNRELFLAETQETIKPHPKFMLFATQNPPGLYGGRKVLSRAFRNRFIEIQVDEPPSSELQTILQERSALPPSFCALLIEIMRQLQLVRQQSSIFAGKSGFITTRDLLRWAERRPMTKQQLAEEGYCLLAERLRRDEEKNVVRKVLEDTCKVKIDLDALYYRGEARESTLLNENGDVEHELVWGTPDQFARVQSLIEQAIQERDAESKSELSGNAAGLDMISVTKSLRRLFALVGRCLQHKEPVLLVGETGCGKTTVCQLYSLLLSQKLHVLNCHQHTETSDFLGCLRPVRGKEHVVEELKQLCLEYISQHTDSDSHTDKSLSDLIAQVDQISKKQSSEDVDMETSDDSSLLNRIQQLRKRQNALFEWADGPLVESMKQGDLLLVDEVNLAEDAVLERLNSVLEPSRGLLLAEKGGDQVEEIYAKDEWRILATMNPGGDFGKRELSPALRNRFTEIWVPSISDMEDIATIVNDRLSAASMPLVKSPSQPSLGSLLQQPILSFVQQFNKVNGGLGGCGEVTLRDILSWIGFIGGLLRNTDHMSPWVAFVQGAALSVLDGLGLGSDKALSTALKARDEAYTHLLQLVPDGIPDKEMVKESLEATKRAVDGDIHMLTNDDGSRFGIEPFTIPCGDRRQLDRAANKVPFSLKAPTTMGNLFRVLRAMQVQRPILLEGSPGVGKTSLISALAKASGHRVVRINLSEQTDISDLFGSDLPSTTGSESGEGLFEWSDGVFLRALKAGDWVLLDELNLASQSVLEGLNSCLDHRGSVYIPELDREFSCPPSFRVFAAQNPLRQGGGRKGLPKSFLNRFTRVFVDMLQEQDLIHIASSSYPQFDHILESTSGDMMEESTLLKRLIQFNTAVHEDTMVTCQYGRLGSPWEFNLRDVFRFCDLLKKHSAVSTPQEELQALQYYARIIYVERMRSARDRELISQRFKQLFGVSPEAPESVSLRVTQNRVLIGRSELTRQSQLKLGRVVPPVLDFLLKPMEALVHCVNMSWPALLIGPPASGKTSAVRLLAALSGNTLHELGMSSGTDATELLGCFEQVDVGRKLRTVKKEVAAVYRQVLPYLATAAASCTSKERGGVMKAWRRLTNAWWSLCKREGDQQDDAFTRRSTSTGVKRAQATKNHIDSVLVELLQEVLTSIESSTPYVESSNDVVSEISTLRDELKQVVALSSSKSIASRFEWMDGSLLHALEHGEWILLDNVNFCSSSVLDRLNALMEAGGELLVNECGLVNGELRVIKPHPNFRLFLAMDPQFGEVSRAMRNRCIEIAVLERSNDEDSNIDGIKVVASSGVPGLDLCNAFCDLHTAIVKEMSSVRGGGRMTRRYLENWSALSMKEVQRGVPVMEAVASSLRMVYGADLLNDLNLEELAKSLFMNALKSLAEDSSGMQRVHMRFPLSTRMLCQNPDDVIMQQDFAYVDYLVACLGASNADDSLLLTLTGNQRRPVQEEQLHAAPWAEYVVSTGDHAKVLSDQKMLKEAAQSLRPLKSKEHTVSFELALYALQHLRQVASSLSNRNVYQRLSFALHKVIKAHPALDNSQALLLARFLSFILHNDFVKRVMEHLESTTVDISSVVEDPTSLHWPLYSFLHDASYQRIRSTVQKAITSTNGEKRSQLQTLWASVDARLRQLRILSEFDWSMFCERGQLDVVDAVFGSSGRKRPSKNSKSLTEYSLLQQSYAVQLYQADSSEIDLEMILQLYPLLEHFDKFVLALLGSSDSIGAKDSNEMEWFQSALRARYDFATHLDRSTLDWTRFLVHWKWLTKSIKAYEVFVSSETGADVSTSYNDLMTLAERMQSEILQTIGRSPRKNTLWKNGGHALLPKNSDMWHAQYLLEKLSSNFMHANESCFSAVNLANGRDGSVDGQVDVLALLFGGVSSMEAAMKSGRLDVSPLFFVDTETRKEVLHALCAFSYMAQQHTRTSGEAGGKWMSQEILKLPPALLKKIRQSQEQVTSELEKKTLYLRELEDTPENAMMELMNDDERRLGRDVPILLFDLKDSAAFIDQLVQFQLGPLIEVRLAKEELALITRLIDIANSYHVQAVDIAETKLENEIASVLTELEKLVQKLMELGLRDPATYHAYQDLVWSGHAFLNKADDVEGQGGDIGNFMDLLTRHTNTVLFGFFRFLRCNSFNDSDAVALEIFNTQRRLRNLRKHSTAVGSNDSELSARVTSGLPRLLQCVESALVLNHVGEVDLEQSTIAVIEAPVRTARLAKVQHNLLASTGITSDVSESITSLLRTILVSTIMAFKKTFTEEHWLHILAVLQKRLTAATDVPQLLQLLKQSSDDAFVSRVDSHIAHVLGLLCSENSSGDIRALGLAMVQLGVLRMELLAPSSPVDPSSKPLVKQDALLQRLAGRTLHDAAVQASQRLHVVPEQSDSVAKEETEELEYLYNRIKDISAYSVQRYQESKSGSSKSVEVVSAQKFAELFRELLRFQMTILSPQKLGTITQQIQSSESLPVMERLQGELEILQQTVEGFVHQICSKYFASFRDVIEPVSASISTVVEGLGLLVMDLQRRVVEMKTKVQEQDKAALMQSLVQFPSVPRANTSAWREIDGLLNATGKQSLLNQILGYMHSSKGDVALLEIALDRSEFQFRRDVMAVIAANQSVSVSVAEKALDHAKSLFDAFLTKWKDQQNAIEQKRLEEEELVKYKTRQVDLETEEELLEKEYQEQFPDYGTSNVESFLNSGQQRGDSSNDIVISDKLLLQLFDVHVSLYAVATHSNTVSRSRKNALQAFARSFTLATRLHKAVNALSSGSIEQSILASGNLAASIVQSRLEMSSVPSLDSLSSTYVSGIDFHRDPFVKEMILVARPLQDLLIRVQGLLAMWPDHAILQQIVRIADRIRNFAISVPLAQTLTSVELLLRKAQDWEAYAARDYSISAQLSPLSALVTRWRKLELYSWPHLLVMKEKQHRNQAQKSWLQLYSLLTSPFEADVDSSRLNEDLTAKSEIQWLYLNAESSWIFLHDGSAAPTTEKSKWMSELFSTLDSYLRSCPIGQYETRLLLVYSLCCQLLTQFWNSSSSQHAYGSHFALGKVLYHLYRYYGQHLTHLGRQWDGLKAPIQKKLEEFVKIARWDEQTYYSLAESAEKSHRKLMKFVRDYDAVLTVPMQSILDTATDNGISKEGGFVGINATKTDLTSFNDYTPPPKDEEEDTEMSETEPEQIVVLRLSPEVLQSKSLTQVKLVPGSTYAERLPKLSKRITEFTTSHILSREEVKCRQKPMEVVEELCSAVFYRMDLLQKKSKELPKGAKKKALIDLLSELKTQGLEYHRLRLPEQQQRMEDIFAIDAPEVLSCLELDDIDALVDLPEAEGNSGQLKKKGKAKKKEAEMKQTQIERLRPKWLWERADSYYYRFLSQLSSLRFSAASNFSKDLSMSEVDRMSGYAENMLLNMLQQRQLLHASSLSHEHLMEGLSTLSELHEFKSAFLQESSSSQSHDLDRLVRWKLHQLDVVLRMRTPLEDLEAAIAQLVATSGSNSSTSSLMDVVSQCSSLLDQVEGSLKSSSTLPRSLGAPPVHHSSLLRLAQPMNAIASKERCGVSPEVNQITPKPTLPTSIDVLEKNSNKLEMVLSKLGQLAASVTSVAPSASVDQLHSALVALMKQDRQFRAADVSKSMSIDTLSTTTDEALHAFTSDYDDLVETVLVGVQEATKLSKSDKSEEVSEESTLTSQMNHLTQLVKAVKIKQISSKLSTVLAKLSDQYTHLSNHPDDTERRDTLSTCLSMMEAVNPALEAVKSISRQLIVDLLVTHKSMMKLDYVLVRVFRNLFFHGFCRTEEEEGDESGEGDGKMQFQDDVEGTGMGEGEGKKDVSDQIEDEEQLLGLQGEEQNEQSEGQKQDQDKGMEMENDFEGTMEDVPDEEQKEDDKEEEGEELDREMGDLEQDEENVVDEKMWGDDSDDEDDKIDKQKEKFEENANVDGEEQLEDEIRGKDDDDAGESEKKQEEDKPPQQEPETKEDEGMNEDKPEDPVNDDLEDNYEEHHQDVDAQEQDERGEEEGEDLPDDMQLDGDDEDGQDEPEGNAADQGEDEDMEEAGQEDESMEPEVGDDKEEEKEEEEEMDENAASAGAGGLEDDVEDESKEEQEAPEPQETIDDDENKASAAVAGEQATNQADDVEQSEEQKDEEEGGEMNEEQQEEQSSNSKQKQASSDVNASTEDEWRPTSEVDSSSQAQTPKEQQKRRKEEPNPYRDAQNAQEHWKRRVEMIEREADDTTEDSSQNRHENEDEEMTAAEFADEDEDAQHALAPADENQVMGQEQEGEEEKDTEMGEPEDGSMGAAAMQMEEEEKTEEEERSKPQPREEGERDHEARMDMLDPDFESKPDDESNKDKKLDGEVDNDEDLATSMAGLQTSNPAMDSVEAEEEMEVEETSLLTEEDVAKLREDLDEFIAQWGNSDNASIAQRGSELWSKYAALTSFSSQRLCEQLRLVLEPMLRAKLEGDFRTGKRINMRKVIPYIASQFRKDKIWMRRTKPSKRAYQVMVAIDDSESMADNHAGRLALEAMTTLCRSLTQLEVGELAVAKFGQKLELLHAFDAPFTDDAGGRVIAQFGFQQKKTHMVHTLDSIVKLLDEAKLNSSAGAGSTVDFTQIVFLISDGRFDSDGRIRIKKLIEKALEQQQLIVLLVVDQGDQEGTSILDTKSVSFAKGKVTMVPYLESYPFPYYVILPTSSLLPEILADSLRQWFEMLRMQS